MFAAVLAVAMCGQFGYTPGRTTYYQSSKAGYSRMPMNLGTTLTGEQITPFGTQFGPVWIGGNGFLKNGGAVDSAGNPIWGEIDAEGNVVRWVTANQLPQPIQIGLGTYGNANQRRPPVRQRRELPDNVFQYPLPKS
jgi:hypothetical protein